MDYSYENKLREQGYECICGIDEAGRGALAGPLVAGAVILDASLGEGFENIKDSKLLNDKKRRELLNIIMRKCRAWSIGIVRQNEIDKHGLSLANKMAMKRAWQYLPIKPDFILSDYMAKLVFSTPFELVVKGDRKIISIAAASIVAKVFRDNMMNAFDKNYPEYGFAEHKGYGTKNHLAKIKEVGACPIHRMSFEPMKAKLF